nr:hypothetical protein [Nocardiopsis algeriensis]
MSAAAIGGGLWLAKDDPGEPHAGDVHTAATGCDAVSDDVLAEHLPGAVRESTRQGPLDGGDSLVCVWSGLSEGAERSVLRVSVSALFTDTAAEEPVTGAERVQQAYAALVPDRAETVDGGSRVWAGQQPGAVELARASDNLLVRISYTGVSGGEPVDHERAREAAVAFDQRIGEAL